MRTTYGCLSSEHVISRRSMLANLLGGVAGVAGLNHFAHPAVARQLQANGKRVLVFFLAGGASQLESWDPKPKTDNGGPFRAIPTSVPGVHISELLPHTAQQMHRLAIVRSINTKESNHGKGKVFMETGRREMPGFRYPVLGSVASSLLSPQSPLPGYIHISPRGAEQNDAAFLGPRFASVTLDEGKPPGNLARPASVSEAGDLLRNEFRRAADAQFGRRTADTEAYSQSFDQAGQLIRQQDIFDLESEPARDRERYGSHDFGRHCLLARRLLERGITCVKVTHSNYDTHSENFDFHLEQLGEFDQPFATLIADLAERGMLEETLVLVMAEFGRTPRINRNLGRDHWGTAWSMALAGCGIQPGAVIGKTNANGTAVIDRQVDGGHLFHTYLRALALDPQQNHVVNGNPVPIGDPAAAAIKELLA